METENKQRENTCNHSTSNKKLTTKCCNGSVLDNSSTDLKVPVIPLTVDSNNVIEGAKEILKVIRTDWDINAVEFKLFTDGITNKLVGCFLSVTDDAKDDDNEISSARNVVLVRVYGNKTDLLIDRKAETRNIKLLHTYGFAPSLYAVFNNGLAYEYVPGVTLTPETIIKPEIWNLIARRMAEMHKVKSGNKSASEPMLWKKVQQFLDLVPEQFSDTTKHQRLEKTFLPVSRLRNEFKELYAHLEKLGSPIVFAHNDLLLGNVIYTESLNRVMFIDYEYADYNFQAFDIGNHFTEFAGIDQIDYSRYPCKEFQIKWLTTYLQTYNESDQVDPEEIHRLYVQVNQFALASHFFWAVWALIQVQHSTIDFDFVQFAHMRYGEYLDKKERFLSLKYQ